MSAAQMYALQSVQNKALNCVLQLLQSGPQCQVCNKALPSTSAVLEHLNAAHPSAILASFVTSQRGTQLLVHHDYVYTLKKSTQNRHHWDCDQRRLGTCTGRARTRGVTYDDVTSIVVRATQHNHPPSGTKIRRLNALQRLRTEIASTDASPLELRQRIASADPEVASALPSLDGIRKLRAGHRAKRRNQKCDLPLAPTGDT